MSPKPKTVLIVDDDEGMRDTLTAILKREYRVLRGGSWMTDPLVARVTFRNWDFPQRRHIFSGLRCASDV